ncbi:amino acid adenylation domain-containing protein [Kitasatospora sp. NPDC059673]|uniref:amino acid adenylation domain-containing protein n=1 Tax=Kitasatospora sp. NPDC059673 TaxID=3346901 RepID=UPI0036A7F3EB
MTGQADQARSGDPLEQRLAALGPAQRELVRKIMEQGAPQAPEGVRRRPANLTEIPASFEQERLWFMNELLTHREIFHVPIALRITGDLDTEALRRALRRLTDRHEALRTVFTDTQDGPRQIVLDTMAIELPVADCTAAPDPRAEARRLAAQAVTEPFDLRTGPLLRCALYRTGPAEHLLLIVQHHIVSDYWSLGILLGDLGACYAAETGHPAELEAIDLHYPDFADWQRRTMNADALGELLDHWRTRLADLPGTLELPTDRPRPPIRSSQGRFHRVEFPPELVTAMRALAKECSTTLHVTFLAAYFALLERLTRRQDLVVGVPVAGRTRPELQRMVGYFLNWLPVRVRLDGRPSLRELVVRTREAFTAALAHQDLPFDMLVRELQPSRTPGVTPVFQTSFSLRDSAPTVPALPGLETEFADLDGGATHFDLMAELWCEGEAVVGYFPYDDELFDETTVADFVRWMTRLLAEGTARPDLPIAAVPLAAVPAQAVAGPAAAAPRAATTLHGAFRAQAERRPDAVAVSDDRGSLSYRELAERADRLAHRLRGEGVGPGTVVGLLVERTTDLAAAVLAVLQCGAAYLPIDPDNPAERTAVQFADCAVTVAVVAPALTGRLPDRPVRAVPLDADAGPQDTGPVAPVDVPTPPESPAYVIYTSGSTGVPKGVVVSHANVLALFDGARRDFELGEDDVWTMFHSYAFDFSVWELWGALLHGGRLVVVPYWITRAPDAFLDLLEHERVTVLSQTPSAFAQLAALAAPERRELALRYVVFGGERLDLATLSGWLNTYGDQAPQLVNMYGITETTVHVTFRPVTAADAGQYASPIGRPLAHLALYLLDEELQPVPDGIPGEIHVGGAGVASYYQAAPAITAARMVPDPFTAEPGARMYRSGDIAVRRRDGELVYLGRADQQHKIRGHRVETGEIRSALLALDGVAQGAVFVTDDRLGGKSLLACVVPATDPDRAAAPTPTQIRRGLLRTLPEWMVPATVLLVEELPLTRNGKLDERALAALQRQETRLREPSEPPHGPTALALAAIWEELLGVTGIGGEDNFFELGGHSLMVVQLVSRIHRSLGVVVPMETLFLRPELQAMADGLDELEQSADTGLAVAGEDWIEGLSEAELDAMLAALDDEDRA